MGAMLTIRGYGWPGETQPMCFSFSRGSHWSYTYERIERAVVFETVRERVRAILIL
jgi:hypothetical protein